MRHALVLAAACAWACSREEKPAFESRPPPSPMPIDAAIGEAPDPAPPAGDFKGDVDRFLDLDSCVAERAKLDPLVGDAIGAIGYDTFLRDTCRMVEAAKAKRREPCDRIEASALRDRCLLGVAIAGEQPETCPLDAVLARGRNPTCLALASRDPRLCVGEARSADRQRCEAVALRDAARCAPLANQERARCLRDEDRWRNMVGSPAAGTPLRTRARLTLLGEGAPIDADLTVDFEPGIVLVTAGDRARADVGTLGATSATSATRFPPGAQRRPRVGFAIAEAGKTTLTRLELEVPGEAAIACPGARCAVEVTEASLPRKRGETAKITWRGDVGVGVGARTYRVNFELTTFVRDVVTDPSPTRALDALPSPDAGR